MARIIKIEGAREHNLRNVSLEIPRDQFVVVTGLSGSGKSSLAFDTLYAEGQRRYLESLSAYARQFLQQMKKPAVDNVEGLSPCISIEQKNISKNPRSTVGTVTEIYDYLRLLFARIGKPHCYQCGEPVQSQSHQKIVDHIKRLPAGTKFAILAPIIRDKKGEYQKELTALSTQGYIRAKIDGKVTDLSSPIRLKKNLKHNISVYIDRLIMKRGLDVRLTEDIELATELAGGFVQIELFDTKEETLFSTRFACPQCGISFEELEPRSFSFNSTHGACQGCNGLGTTLLFDKEKLVPDTSLSLKEGAILPWRSRSQTWQSRLYSALKAELGIDIGAPFRSLSKKSREIVLNGSEKPISFSFQGKKIKQVFEGVIPSLTRQLEEAQEDSEEKYELQGLQSPRTCADCEGSRLKPFAKAVLLNGKSIAELCAMNVLQAKSFLSNIKLNKQTTPIATPILKDIDSRLIFLDNVGLSYLTLSRSAATLSGGEAQRIRLATQIGSSLVGVLYILDEPSIGLHQRDNQRLIHTLKELRDRGNSVIVVEHDEETIACADYVIDMGPGAGELGGHVVYAGPGTSVAKQKGITGQYMSGQKVIPVPKNRRKPDAKRCLKILGAKENNLKNVDVSFPLGTFVCVTGVSGSGKSSLIIDTLLKIPLVPSSGSLQKNYDSVHGMEQLDKIIHVDQSPIGRTPRSNPATYSGLFTDIRALFSELPESKMRGYKPSRFSFNVAEGRCEACNGDGNLKVEMHFLPAVYVPCEVCRGKRYNRETLQIRYRGQNISDVLNLTAHQALKLFENIPHLKAKLTTLNQVGLGYVTLGQNAVTLSGGEAQRIKLSRELNKRATGRTLYVFDEPTTGLHFEDVAKLMQILHRLVDGGNTVVVIEHHLDVIKQADYIIDLGPEGGQDGGTVLFEGTPEAMIANSQSHTARFLKPVLQAKRGNRPVDDRPKNDSQSEKRLS